MTSQRRWGRGSEARFLLAVTVLYTAIAFIYLVLPVVGRFDSVLLGSQRIPGDSLLGAAILEWGFRSLWSAHLRFFEWNAGFPIHNSLAITENLIGWQVIYSPLRFTGVGVAAAYNTVR